MLAFIPLFIALISSVSLGLGAPTPLLARFDGAPDIDSVIASLEGIGFGFETQALHPVAPTGLSLSTSSTSSVAPSVTPAIVARSVGAQSSAFTGGAPPMKAGYVDRLWQQQKSKQSNA
ncbi:hypothetical protein BC835DRAFT_1414479 [Cytidiella melzeri]|nr:hypothetical protein BC835DRAFT_1414479 [Cytidiella melzeri]